MAGICYEVVTDASSSATYESRPSHSRRRQSCKRKTQASCSSISRSSREDLVETKRVINDDNVDVNGEPPVTEISPRYGFTSVCGRRREMEDAVAIHPSFSSRKNSQHYFGVYDGHGCSHVRSRFFFSALFRKFEIFRFRSYDIDFVSGCCEM